MKEKKLRKRVFFTFMVLLVSSALTQIPVYGINSSYMSSIFEKAGILSFIDSLSGGSLSNLSVAGFGITSYITASIVLQLLAVVFPKIENIRKDGEQGRKLIEKITFVLGIIFTVTGGAALAIGFGKQGLLVKYSPLYVVIAVACWLAGSFIIMFLGQKVEEHGIGNGITMILGFNILSRIPYNIISYYKYDVAGKKPVMMAVYIAGLILALFVFYLIAVYLQTGVLNIPIKQTRKQASVVNTDGVLPVNVNIANVLPMVYASSIISIPSLVIAISGVKLGHTAEEVFSIFSSSNWYRPEHWFQPLGLLLYVLLIIGFAFFSSSLSFSVDEIADSMKKNGNVIPNINPGADTVKFLEKRRKVMSSVNVVFLVVLAIVPDFICSILGITSFTFLGTSLVIIIGMLFDTALRFKAVSLHNDKRFKLFGNIKEV